MNITTALVIADPWIGMILDGSKTWEMRSTNTSRRGWIGLIRKGTGCVWGIAQIADSGLPMSPEKMIETFEKHRIPEHMIRSGEVSKWNTPWILKDVRVLNQPVPYTHKLGAVTWVSLDSEVSQAITQQLTLSHTVDHVQSLQRPYVHALTHLINFFGAINEPPDHSQRDHRALFAFGADRFEALFC